MNNVNNKKQKLLDEYRERMYNTLSEPYDSALDGEVNWLKSKIEEFEFDEEKAYDQGFKDAQALTLSE